MTYLKILLTTYFFPSFVAHSFFDLTITTSLCNHSLAVVNKVRIVRSVFSVLWGVTAGYTLICKRR